jgi:hypothetical protein
MDELTLALQRFDLLAYVEAKGAVKDGRDEMVLFCPQCETEKLTVNPHNRMWRCFRCEYLTETGALHGAKPRGNVFQLVEWLEGTSKRDTARFILERASGQTADAMAGPLVTDFAPVVTHALKRPTGLPESCVAITAILPYMKRRGITLEDAAMFGLGHVPAEAGGWLANRIIFPVWDRGQCLYWQARACWDVHEHVARWPGDKFRKSLNPSSERNGQFFLGSSDVVGNLESAVACSPRPVIVEGPTSGIRTGPDAMWTFGKNLYPAQVVRMVEHGVRAVDFMWDGPSAPDAAGVRKEPLGAWPDMLRHAPTLVSAGIDVRVVFIPQGDPGDYSRAEVAEMRRVWSRPFAEVSTWSL